MALLSCPSAAFSSLVRLWGTKVAPASLPPQARVPQGDPWGGSIPKEHPLARGGAGAFSIPQCPNKPERLAHVSEVSLGEEGRDDFFRGGLVVHVTSLCFTWNDFLLDHIWYIQFW